MTPTLPANAVGTMVVSPCRGMCKGDRPASDGPQRYGSDSAGRKGVYCTCCEQWMMRVGRKDFSQAIAEGRVMPGVTVDHATLLSCVNCGYESVSMTGVSPA